MGCDSKNKDTLFWDDVSIHAPAWGATAKQAIVYALQWVSIHAPAWGATRKTHLL